MLYSFQKNHFKSFYYSNENNDGALKTSFWNIFDPGHPEQVGCDDGWSRTVGIWMWGLFQVINVTILLNLCVALMNSTISTINMDKEKIWKFYRTDSWMLFLIDRSLPIPFNIWSSLVGIINNYFHCLPDSYELEIDSSKNKKE